MQWSPDRNGGFSAGDFAQLVVPPLMDPVYGFQSVNVEAGLRDPSSFLQWLQRMLSVRRQLPVFATGSLHVLPADNPSVLAYLRELEDDEGRHSVLCVYNLSRFAQSAQVSLGGFVGARPIELIGRSDFPQVSGPDYPITLAPHGFYWLELAES
jgi:maltose alpha-D-glucosyltransferase/alpha-amylase